MNAFFSVIQYMLCILIYGIILLHHASPKQSALSRIVVDITGKYEKQIFFRYNVSKNWQHKSCFVNFSRRSFDGSHKYISLCCAKIIKIQGLFYFQPPIMLGNNQSSGGRLRWLEGDCAQCLPYPQPLLSVQRHLFIRFVK